MRQSLSENRTGRTTALLAVGLSLVLAAIAVTDQAGGRSLIEHATAVYAPFGKHPTASITYGLIYTVAVVDAVVWLLVTVLASRRVIAQILGILAIVVTAALGVALLTSTEYGVHPFPPLWGVLALLPAAAGVLWASASFRRG
jgi:hypothetical protein